MFGIFPKILCLFSAGLRAVGLFAFPLRMLLENFVDSFVVTRDLFGFLFLIFRQPLLIHDRLHAPVMKFLIDFLFSLFSCYWRFGSLPLFIDFALPVRFF